MEEEHEHDEAPVAADDHADSEDFIPALWSWITFLGEARRLL